ncbi:receptor-type tyrosine-protein phosphatase delta-like [Patiria miniata]|uniref:protein-tyrosine-phosphatase n=1 Tax=Patiria miniata TaxID=46514 RepID=A0A913ZDP5_PATMI|nr:receptor-type tyrosine-protein phosphatase delta-like [Patiria miniata]
MAATRGVVAVLCVLFSLGLFLPVTGKDPYLDFTCVASQALVPTASHSGEVTITAHTPLRNASVSLDGETRTSFNPSRVGDFVCSLETEDFEAVTTVIISTEDANLYPSRLTVTSDPLIDNEINIRMTARDECESSLDYKWFEVRSSERIVRSPDLMLNSDRFGSRSSIVFENFCTGGRSRSGYVQILLRECPSGKWSPGDGCQLDCSICLNGGMCHPQMGECICPPGFSGSECQNVHGRNVFGQLAQYNCSGSADPHHEGCRGQLFCLPEPFGCTCAAGYQGISCTEECEEGKYGANCEQICHCQDNSTCLADTGECDGSPCLEGWDGPNCQETGVMITLEYNEVNINQMTNVTCSVNYASPLNESEFVLVLPDGREKEADYFIEYESPVTMEYIFVVVADSLTAPYTCSSVSMDSNATITVTAFEPPQLSSPPNVSESTRSSITLTWEAWDAQAGDRGEGPLVNYIISYRELNANGTIGDIITPGDTLSDVVPGLKEGTSYEFRVSAVRPGVGGVGPPSPPTIGNTSCAVPGKPTNLNIRPINSTAFRLSWLRPADTTCPAITYHIRYWFRKYEECETNLGPTKTAQTSDQSLIVGGLLPYASYKFEVKSQTDAESSRKAGGRSTTRQSVPGPPMLQPSASTNTTLEFSWTAPDCTDRNGIILGYHYQLLHRHGNILSEGVTSSSDEAMVVGFENLEPCTEYQFQVRGWTSAGNGSFSEPRNVTTEEGVPDRISSLNVSSINSTQLRISWSPPAQAPCQIVGYGVSYALLQQGRCGPAETTETIMISDDDVLTVDVPGLLPDSEYQVDVRATTSAGQGEGFDGTGRTFEGVPGPPTSVTVNDTTSSSLIFMWEPPVCTERNGLITSYRTMLWNADTGVVENTTISETHVQFESLLACTTYSFQVGAVTSAGLGSITDVLSWTTGPELPEEVTDIQFNNGSRTLTITWQPPTGTLCNITGYNVTYKLIKHLACDDDEDIDYENIDEVSVTTTDPNYSAMGLSPYSTYLVSVAAWTLAGVGNWTRKYANTSQDRPSPPVSVYLTLATPSALGFSWHAPNCTDRNGIIEGYHYLFFDSGSDIPAMESTDGNVTSITFEGLKACNSYIFKVRAQTVVGNGQFSSMLETSTEGQAPNAVTNFGADPSARSLALTWTKPVNTTCYISSYLISYKLIRHLQCPENEIDAPVVIETTNGLRTGYAISGLSPASRYFVSVRAETIGGVGEEKSLEVDTLEAAPAKPTNVTLYEATSRSLTFTWEHPLCSEMNGVILNYVYKFVETEERSRIDENDVPPNITSLTVDELSPCTEYHFKVRAKTSADLGAFSGAIHVFTEGEVPKAVTNVNLISSSHSITVTWTPPSTRNCVISGYLITYKLNRHLECAEETVDSVEFNDTLSSSSREHVISGLLPASMYSVTVLALNEHGRGEPVGREIATMESGPGPVSNVSIISVGRYSANFSWYPPSCEDSHGNITGYVWTIDLDGSSGQTMPLTERTADTSIMVTALKPCSLYTFSVHAVTSAGPGQESTSSPFTTLAAVPEKVETRLVSKNSTFAQIAWPSPVTPDNPCPIQQYTSTYYLKKLKACQLEILDETFTVNTSDTQLNLMDLRPYSVYKVSVAASTMAGYGETSDEYKLETDPAVPAQVTGVRVANSTMDSLRFAWNELECEARHDKITGYRYEFRNAEDSDDADDLDSEEDSELFAAFDDLHPCTEYKFRVRAIGKTKLGVWSDWVKAVTSTVLPEPVQNLTLRRGDVPATEIQVSWQPSPLDDCFVSNYQVGYKAQSLEECSLNSSRYNWTYINVDRMSAVLSSLQAYSLYTVTVRGETAAGLGQQASAVLQTAEDVPMGPPENITTSLIGPKELHFTWKPPMCGLQNGIITSYNYTLTDPSTNVTQKSGSVLTMDVLIGGLVPYVLYQFSVQANTAIGPGPVSHLVVRTEEGAPPPPRIFVVVTVSRFTLQLQWNPPEPPSGVLSAYQIKYWASSLDESSADTIEPLFDMTSQVHRYTITELRPYTDYNIQIRAKNGAGYGEWTEIITSRTAQGAPEMPANVNVRERTETTITIDWNEPQNPNGVLTGYKIEHRIVDRPFGSSSSDTPVSESYRVITISRDVTEHQIGNLEAATGYEVRLAAKTVEFGDYVTLRRVYTMIPAINKPTMTDPPSLGEDNTVTLQLKPVSSPYISVYQVTVAKSTAVGKRDAKRPGSYKQSPNNYIAGEFNKTDLPSTFKVGDNKTYGGYHNAALQPGTTYAIQFCGVGKTQQDTQSSCSEESSVTTNPINTGPGIEVILAAVIAVLVLVAVVLVVMVVIRKRRQSTKSTQGTNGMVLADMEKAEARANGLQNQAMVEEMVRSQLRRSGGVKGESTTPVPHPQKEATPPKKAWKLHKAVSLQDLPQYVKRKKANGNKGFIRDYASFPDNQLYSSNVAQKDINKNKNRYANIIPYDHSRVVLDPINDDPETDYINASYIDGYKQKYAYIATQGPNKSSTPDFWRMVWQQEVAIIVMLTNTVENAKKKCIQYWPDDQLDYKSIVVKKVSERVEQDFTERVFVIANMNFEEDLPREVKQFHYTSWPDMGLPDSPAPLMNFIHEVKQVEESGMGPMVVHCSAGVGRTGTFITVDAMLNMVAEEKQINVIDFVYEMRKKRPRMVQTQEQYMFIFEVLLETLLCGDTVMNLSTFPAQYAALGDCNPLTGSSYVEEHFRVLDTMSVAPGDDNCFGGRNEMNQDKNLYQDCIPLDKSRPYLMSPGEEGSTNYINASFIDAYKRKDGFLAAQSPLPNTVVDFWRMVYDYNARVIVMLNEIDGSDETCAPYWIDDPEETALFGIFEVQLRDCKDFKHTIARTFKLKNTNKASEKPRTIHHFEFLEWSPEEEIPPSIVPFLGFMELVEQSHRQTGGDGRIAVHCLDGVSRSGIFCTAMASLEKLKEEKVVDVFHAVRNLRRNRHTMVDSQDQYLFCYDVLSTYLEENQTYANFR